MGVSDGWTRRSVLTAVGSVGCGAGLAGCVNSDTPAEGRTVYSTYYIYPEGSNQDAAVTALDAETGEEYWQFEVEMPRIGTPIVVDGVVFFLAVDTLYALDAQTGDQYWRNDTLVGGGLLGPSVVNGTVFKTSEQLRAINAATGNQEWAFESRGAPFADSSPHVRDGTVFVGAEDGVYAVEAATGKEEWFTEIPYEIAWSSPTVSNGTVYVGVGEIGDHERGGVYALDAGDGTILWRAITESPVEASPTVTDGLVYVTTDGATHAINAETGEQVWEQANGEHYTTVTVADGLVVGSRHGFDAQTGEVQWQFITPQGIVRPTIHDQTVYGTSNYRTVAIDLETGTKKWETTQVRVPNFYPGLTVVEDPESGHSVGSRVELGTAAHHHSWAGYEDQQIPIN